MRSRWTKLCAIAFAFVLVASFAGAPLAAGTATATTPSTQPTTDISPLLTTTQNTTDNASYYTDFENGSAPDWNSSGQFDVVNESFYGDYSIYQNDYGANDYSDNIKWTGGPQFNTKDNFELSGTYRASGSGSSRVRLGLIDGSSGGGATADYEGAMINHYFGDDKVYLATNYAETDDAYSISNISDDEWLNFRLQIDSGTAKLKVWAAGTGEPNNWQAEREYSSFDARFFAYPGRDGSGREVYLDQIDAGGNAISGQVVDQETGEPVPNATVGGIGVNSGAINDTIEDKQAEAEELLEQAQSIEIPDEWNPDYDPQDQIDDSGTYLLAHEASDWGGTNQVSVDPQSSIDSPGLQFDGDEQIILSIWDGSQNGDWIENQYDGSFTGKIVEQKINIKQFAPGGEPADVETYEPEVLATSGGTGPLADRNEHYGVSTHLSTGIYHVYPEGSPEKGYTIMVGDAEDQWTALADRLETESGQLSDRVKELESNVESGLFERRTTTTNETGHYTLRMQTGVQRASVQAYRADGTVLPALTGPSFDDLRTAVENRDYNGTFDLSPPGTYTVPTENLTLETYRTDELPYQGIDSFDEFKNWVKNQQLNETIEELQSEYDQRFSELNRTQLEARYTTHKPLIENVPGAQDSYLERSEFDSIQAVDDLSNDELATEVSHMETALSGIEEIDPPDPGDVEDAIDISDGELNAEYGPIPGGIDTDTLQPEIHWSDGSSEEIPDEYWSVESQGTVTSSNYLVVEGFPIEETDPAAFDLRVLGGGAGGVLDDRLSSLNPSFGGTIPDVQAIDISTLSPGDSERVSMTMRPSDDSSYESLRSVEVIGPEGQQLATDVSGDGASFTTNGAGEHFIRATVTDTTGSEFVHSFSVRALDQGRSNPPTVRAETATGDQVFAVAGDGLDDARIASESGTLDVDAIVPGGEIPGSVHIKPQAAMTGDENDLEIQILEGSDESAVSSNIETVIHVDSLSTDSRVWRGEPGWLGKPLEWDGGSRYGSVTERGDKAVIRTYTDGDGSVELTIDSRDGFAGMWDSYRHGFASKVPRFNLPFGLGMIVPAAGGATAAGAFLWFSRRRYSVWFWR